MQNITKHWKHKRTFIYPIRKLHRPQRASQTRKIIDSKKNWKKIPSAQPSRVCNHGCKDGLSLLRQKKVYAWTSQRLTSFISIKGICAHWLQVNACAGTKQRKPPVGSARIKCPHRLPARTKK